MTVYDVLLAICLLIQLILFWQLRCRTIDGFQGVENDINLLENDILDNKTYIELLESHNIPDLREDWER